jgi:hypothetical protein
MVPIWEIGLLDVVEEHMDGALDQWGYLLSLTHLLRWWQLAAAFGRD